MKVRDVRRRVPRMDRRIVEHVHDPYKTRLKLTGPTVCPKCSAVFQKGRWRWPSYPPVEDAHHEICQACHRIIDDYPAGWLTITGDFAKGHKEEIVGLARNQEDLEKGEHPLHRIMEIKEEDGGIVITTTDIHLPRRIGEALHHAYRGDLDFHYIKESYLIRVLWTGPG